MLKKIFVMIMVMFCTVGCVQEEVQSEMKTDFVTLNSGYKMPRLGLGTWTLNDDTAKIAFITR